MRSICAPARDHMFSCRVLLRAAIAGAVTVSSVGAALSKDQGDSAGGPADAGADASGSENAHAGPALTAEDRALLREIEESRAAMASTPSSAPSVLPTAPAGSTGFSNLFNPAISLTGLVLGTARTGAGPGPEVGLSMQELELRLASNVDPYFLASATFSMRGLSGVELEEGILTALGKPLGVALRGGKTRVPFGRENALHTHALPFIDRSVVSQDIFGDEGLSEVGLEASWLSPLPWYALLTVAAFDGGNEALFASPAAADLAGLAALKSVFDVTDDATLEVGVSYALGKNQDRELAQALGAHLVFKWRPAREAAQSSLVAVVEGIAARRPSAPTTTEPPPFETGGLVGAVQWQFARRWQVGARFEFLGHRGVAGEEDLMFKQSLAMVFAPTEFSGFRLQGNVTEPPGGQAPVFEAFLQANFTIGAHPTHPY